MGLTIDIFKRGFDWISLASFYPLLGVLALIGIATLLASTVQLGIITSAVSFVLDYLSTFVVMFVVVPIALKHYGLKNPFGSINVKNIIEWVKFAIINVVVTYFNWRSQKIFYMQIGLSVIALYLWFFAGYEQQYILLNQITSTPGITEAQITALAPQIDTGLFLFGSVVLGILWVFSFYNMLRYSLLIHVRIMETDNLLEAVKRAWNLTDGKFFQLFLIFLLWIAFAVVLGAIFVFFNPAPVLINSIIGAVLLMMHSFMFVNYYIALKGGKAHPTHAHAHPTPVTSTASKQSKPSKRYSRLKRRK